MASWQEDEPMLVLRSLFLSLILAVATLSTPAALARAPGLTLGEVSLSPEAPARYKRLLSDTLSHELDAARTGARKAQQSFVVHARLLALETQGSHPAKSRCTVTLVLTRQDTGAIFASAKGSVVVEDTGRERAEALAVESAAKSALKRVNSALGG
jgi:hypothetical protein